LVPNALHPLVPPPAKLLANSVVPPPVPVGLGVAVGVRVGVRVAAPAVGVRVGVAVKTPGVGVRVIVAEGGGVLVALGVLVLSGVAVGEDALPVPICTLSQSRSKGWVQEVSSAS
jgi:hypothetical protein